MLSKLNFLKYYIFVTLFVTLVFLNVSITEAATLNISPSSGSYISGQTFNVNINVSSSDQAMNAVSGVVSFPKDKLEVVSISKNSSVITFWVQDPTFSNTNGLINFEGIVLNPGFTGSAGKVLSVTFKAKAVGISSVSFSSGSVLANDGLGTSILKGLNGASYSLKTAGQKEYKPAKPPVKSEPSYKSSAPKIKSTTHPDPSKWYSKSTAKFLWDIPKGIKGVRLLIGRKSNNIPTVTYIPAISSKTIEDLNDGILYFSARFKDGDGWGDTSRFKIKIDTVSPTQFDIKLPDDEYDLTPTVRIVGADDSRSGLKEYFEVKIDDDEWVSRKYVVNSDGEYEFTLPAQKIGKHSISVKAIDSAGNETMSSEDFTIRIIASPVITSYPREIKNGQKFTIVGTTPHTKGGVEIYIGMGADLRDWTINNVSDGSFEIVLQEKFENYGEYNIWAVASDGSGRRSAPSKRMTITVKSHSWSEDGPTFAMIFIIITLIAFIVFLIWYTRYNVLKLKRRARREIRHIDKELKTLMEDMHKQVIMFERAESRRDLTREEERMVKHLYKYLDNSESLTVKEIRNIRKILK